MSRSKTGAEIYRCLKHGLLPTPMVVAEFRREFPSLEMSLRTRQRRVMALLSAIIIATIAARIVIRLYQLIAT